MQSIRPCRKRAGTSTNATPSDPARRICLGSSSESDRDDKDAKITTWLHNHDPYQKMGMTSPIPIPTYNDYPAKYITPPTPCSSPELQGPFNCQAGINRCGYPINVQHNISGHGTTCKQQRNEFPFPIQALPKHLRNIRRLEVTIHEEPEPGEIDIDIDIDVPSPTGSRTGRPERPYVHPLPTPPRCHPSVPTCFSYSPPSSSYGQQLPRPSSTAPSSGLPSLSSSSSHSYSNTCSPKSPNTPSTPSTPLTRFTSAVAALKLVLMANDIGMSLQELEELNEFAAAPMSGGSDSKRAGRVLVRRDIQQRREKGTGKSSDGGVWTGGQDIFHRQEDCRSKNCGRCITAPVPVGMWRDVEWSRNGNENRSRFSDGTCTTKEYVDMDVDVGGDEETTALEGYIKMAVDAETDGDARQSSSNVNNAVFGTAEVGRRVRPAELRMKTSIERFEAAVGPLGEKM